MREVAGGSRIRIRPSFMCVWSPAKTRTDASGAASRKNSLPPTVLKLKCIAVSKTSCFNLHPGGWFFFQGRRLLLGRREARSVVRLGGGWAVGRRSDVSFVARGNERFSRCEPGAGRCRVPASFAGR